MAEMQEVDPVDAKAMIDAGEADLVDVREQPEWDQARIPGSTLLPLSTFTPETPVGSDGRKLILLCAVGARSAKLGHYLAANGRDEVYNLTGGIKAWAELGLPVEM